MPKKRRKPVAIVPREPGTYEVPRRQKHGLDPYLRAGYGKKDDLGMSRFHEALRERPQDLETYRRFIVLLENDPSLNMSILEMEIAARMMMENDKFDTWLLQEENIDRTKGLEPIFRMLRSNRDHLLKLFEKARTRSTVDTSVSQAAEFIAELKKKGVMEGEYEVVEDG